MSDEWKCVNAHDRCYGGAGGPCDYCERVWPSPEMTPWKIAMEAAADEVAEHLSTPEDVAWAEDAASRILSLPMPPAFRAEVEAEAAELRGVLAEAVAAWPAVLRIIREYDESFPYAEKEGDDEAVTRMRRAIEALRERIGALEQTEDQKWCVSKADEAKERGAPTVEAQLRKAAEHPDTATNIRRVMGRASKAASIIKGTKP